MDLMVVCFLFHTVAQFLLLLIHHLILQLSFKLVNHRLHHLLL
jgi:hypothetical protein